MKNKFLDNDNVISLGDKHIDNEANEDNITEIKVEKENNKKQITEDKIVVGDIEDKIITVENKEKKIVDNEKQIENIRIEKQNEIKKRPNKRQIISDSIEKVEYQLVSKEVDIKLAQEMFKQASSNGGRDKYQRTIENLNNDMKEVRMKKEILINMLKSEK